MNIAEKTLLLKQDFDDVFEAGKKAEYDNFWDIYQSNGEPMAYSFAFCTKWSDLNFYPKYPIVVSGSSNDMFYSTAITNLKARLEDCNVYLDTSGATSFSETFAYSKITHIPELSTLGAARIASPFSYATSLHTIDKLILKADGSQTFGTSIFTQCTALENLVIEGTIGQNGFDVHWSTKLTHDSLMSIINALKDYSNDTSGTQWVVTLGSTNLNKLSDTEKAIATEKGWTLA